MSMDLYLWKSPVTDDPDEAGALLDRYFDEKDASVFEPHADVGRVLEEIRRRYPDDAQSDDGPWSSWPLQDSDRIIVLNIRWSVDNSVLDCIIDLAREHELVVYDPQGPSVYLPDDPPEAESEPGPPPTAWDYVKGVLIVVPFAAATYAAWLIPWGWLRWPLVAIGLFLTAAAVFAAYAIVAAALGWQEEQPSS